jgi:MtaA/CmuA family methyltransferase
MTETGAQLVRAALAGEEVPRFPCAPLAVHYTAALAGVSVRDYTLDPRIMVDCICRYYEQFRPDAVWLSADTWVTAEAMGASVDFVDDNQPMMGVGEPVVSRAADIDAIPPADPSTRGRQLLMLEALSLLRQRLGPDVFIVGCFDQSPFSLGCALMGINAMMERLMTDRPFVEGLLARCIEHAAAYGLEMSRAGADMLSTGDSPAGLIGPELYREIALPATQRVFRSLRASCDTPLSLHICGRSEHILTDMTRTGCDVLEVDHQTDLAAACEAVPPEIALWGNLDPVGLLASSTPDDVRAEARRCIETIRAHYRRRFILSSGCTLAPETPEANLRALFSSQGTW